MKRDGIDPKPSPGAGYGERQYWLLQMLSMTPPSHWSKTFSAAPAQLLAAIPKDYADLVQLAWHNATVNASDPDWAEAFVRLGTAGKNRQLNEHLIKLLPDSRRDDVIYDLLSAGDAPSDTVFELASGPLDARSTTLLIARVKQRARDFKSNYDYEIAQLLPRLALAAPPALLSEFESAWPPENFEAAKKPHEQFFTTLTLRQNIQKEFAR
jgi:hypothetical protein